METKSTALDQEDWYYIVGQAVPKLSVNKPHVPKLIKVKLSVDTKVPYYSLPSINVNPGEWIKVNIYRGVNS